ncbi:MAG: hypothetical protein ACLGHP_01735 [Vicinamibacteria bacterium]
MQQVAGVGGVVVFAALVGGAVAWSIGCRTEPPPGSSTDRPQRVSSLPAPPPTTPARTAATVAAALVLPRTSPVVLDRFYARVRPPGWWPETAARAGEDPRAPRQRATRAVRLTLAAAASLFLALAGGVTLLLSPGASATGWLSLVAALALTPLWWPRRRREPHTGNQTGASVV